eukprot:TRINITY_DN8157_c0_g1_i1.p1 TRINITY_DN8157_c0_g1~~TRINITY_DN8157_c0_g1_i1.p1  ORF type:complete len:224 (-),score=19.16 TRINITY_DN8157_c0_g1_i1:102-773(-)
MVAEEEIELRKRLLKKLTENHRRVAQTPISTRSPQLLPRRSTIIPEAKALKRTLPSIDSYPDLAGSLIMERRESESQSSGGSPTRNRLFLFDLPSKKEIPKITLSPTKPKQRQNKKSIFFQERERSPKQEKHWLEGFEVGENHFAGVQVEKLTTQPNHDSNALLLLTSRNYTREDVQSSSARVSPSVRELRRSQASTKNLLGRLVSTEAQIASPLEGPQFGES